MKKTYLSPVARPIALPVEALMLAQSFPDDLDITVPTDDEELIEDEGFAD
ncbi:MAG: hypothetical protein KBS47_04505 [Bacteroidales bacterium]|nr:hypothetical protein [Candidatus Equimonas enterica]